jgi:hypothetical protein
MAKRMTLLERVERALGVTSSESSRDKVFATLYGVAARASVAQNLEDYYHETVPRTIFFTHHSPAPEEELIARGTQVYRQLCETVKPLIPRQHGINKRIKRKKYDEALEKEFEFLKRNYEETTDEGRV